MAALNQIREQIREAAAEAQVRGGNEPVLIAVSKTQPVEKILPLYRGGQRDFGENYVQELLAKKAELVALGIHDVRFHLIGHLQRNKVKSVVASVECIHSVDSIPLLEEIEKRALGAQVRPGVFFQVKLHPEDQKGGFDPIVLRELEERVPTLKAVRPMGLMCIPDPAVAPERSFQMMQELSSRHGAVLGFGLSMGMSGDFQTALRFGATHVRIGTALFGERER